MLLFFSDRIFLILVSPFCYSQEFLFLLWCQIWVIMTFWTTSTAKCTYSTDCTMPIPCIYVKKIKQQETVFLKTKIPIGNPSCEKEISTPTYLLTIWNFSQSNAVNMIAAITLVTKQHFIFIVFASTFDALLAFFALPRIFVDATYHSRRHF